MWIVRLALRRPYTIAVLCSLIAIFGVLSASRMKTDILPAIDIPVVIVVWSYPGLSAEDIERRVVFISERAMSTTVSGISRIDSESMSGLGVLKVYFEPDSDIGGAIAQIVSVSLTASRVMPPGITPPTIIRYNASNVPVAQMTISSKTLSEQQLYDYGLNFIRLRLFTIPGLATPAPFGGKSRQVMVDIDPARVAAKGLSPNDVVQAVLASNVLVPAGSAQIGGTRYDVQLNSSPESVQEFNQLPIKAVNGATVVLGDVALVKDGYAVQENVVRLNGRRATYLAILKKADASTLAVVEGAKAQLPIIRAAAPEGMELKIDFDQSVFVRAAIQNVLHEAIIASLLVSLMILFFLGSWRGAVLVMASIPLAILCGLVGLFLFGHSLNLMTMGGLALAIGMLVDDATVEVENIHRNRHMGKPLTVAILDGAQQIAVPALAATLTICVVFFPVVLLEGPARFLFTPLALGVVISMLASYLLSRTLVPTLARILMEKEALHPEGNGFGARFNRRRDAAFARFQEGYAATLEAVLHHRGLVLSCSALVLLCSAALPFVVGLDFFPQVDAGQMRLHYRAPVGTRLEETERQVARLEQRLQDIVPPGELETINSMIGLPVSYNLAFVQTDNTGSQDADVLVALKPGHAPTEKYMERIRRELPDEFPGSSLYFQPADIVSQVLNFGLTAPIDVQIDGPDVERSYELARTLLQKIRAIPGATDVRIPQVLAYPALRLNVDRARAAQIGITERDVANNLLVSLSSSSLVAPSFWINPKNNVNYFVAVQTPLRQGGLGAGAARHAAGARNDADLVVGARFLLAGLHCLLAAGPWRRLQRGLYLPGRRRPAHARDRPLDDQPRLGATGGGRAGERERPRPGRRHPRHREGHLLAGPASQGHPHHAARAEREHVRGVRAAGARPHPRHRARLSLAGGPLPVLPRPLHHPGGRPRRPGGHPLDARGDGDHPQRRVVHGGNHGGGNRHFQFHPAGQRGERRPRPRQGRPRGGGGGGQDAAPPGADDGPGHAAGDGSHGAGAR